MSRNSIADVHFRVPIPMARVLWSTTTEEGQKLYGPDYMDIMYFTSYHLTYAAQRNCDHMHDGVGFFTQVRPRAG